MNYGYIKSELDGSEYIYKPNETLDIPESFTYHNILSPILNQGSKPICVPCAISANINWKLNLSKNIVKKDNKVNYGQFDVTENGMQIKQALSYLLHNGVQTDNGNFKIKQYSIVPSLIAAKLAIMINGPIVCGLPVYNSNIIDFWNGYNLEGHHAVSLVGFCKSGFILRNSWGSSYGTKGYTVIDYNDFEKITELWTFC